MYITSYCRRMLKHYYKHVCITIKISCLYVYNKYLYLLYILHICIIWLFKITYKKYVAHIVLIKNYKVYHVINILYYIIIHTYLVFLYTGYDQNILYVWQIVRIIIYNLISTLTPSFYTVLLYLFYFSYIIIIYIKAL